MNTSGAPTTLAGTPVISAYPGNSTTELTAGITLTVDFDARTGLHNVRVVASGANGYATATNYQLVITTGTVGGTSVVGYVVAEFSIENRSAVMPTTAARTLDVSSTGEAGVDWANVGSPTTTVNLSGTTVGTAAAVGSGGIAASSFAAGAVDAAAIAANAIGASEIADGAIDAGALATGAIAAGTFAANALDAAALATDAVNEIWNRACTEPTAVVAASPTAIAALSWMLTLSRNKIEQTSTTQTLRADDGSNAIATATVSDDGTTAIRAEFV